MKKEATEYVARFFTCQHYKFDYQHPTGLLHHIPIPQWKWGTIMRELVTGLPGNNMIPLWL